MEKSTEFFNTIYLEGNELNEALKDVEKQEERIFQIMKLFGGKFTPLGVHTKYEELYYKAPITSIRRAMTTLTNNGRLIKLKEMRHEIYGKPNHLWTVKSQPVQMKLF